VRTASNSSLCGWRRRPQTQKGRMLIYYCCRLRAAVTIRSVEVNGRDAMFVRCAFECGAVIHRSGCVMSHTFTVAPLSVGVWGNRCATLEQEMLSLAGSVDGQYLCGKQDERYRINTRPHSPAIKSLWEQRYCRPCPFPHTGGLMGIRWGVFSAKKPNGSENRLAYYSRSDRTLIGSHSTP
jgi:hypothetical protein